MTGLREAMAFFTASIAVSLSFRESASLSAMETRRPIEATAGDLEIPSSPSFIPFRPPPTAPRDFLKTSVFSDKFFAMSENASLMEPA